MHIQPEDLAESACRDMEIVGEVAQFQIGVGIDLVLLDMRLHLCDEPLTFLLVEFHMLIFRSISLFFC